jgi:hypothetical protein
MKYSLAKQGKSCFFIQLSFDELQPGHKLFHHAIVDGPRKTGPHGRFVFLDSRRTSRDLEY